MLATACPRCGAPAPVHLAATEIDCPSCRTRSPVPDEVRARLTAAGAVLSQVDRRRRQLGQRTRWLITHASIRVVAFGCATAVLVVPFVAMAWVGVELAYTQRGLEVSDLNFLVPCAAPLLLMLLASGLGLAAVRRRARRLREACAAIPPSQPGMPAGCHVCGGPVAQRGTEPIARCSYCGADNVVTPEDMRRAHAGRAGALDAFEAGLRDRAEAAGRGIRRLLLTMVGFASLAPMLGFCGGCCASWWFTGIDTEPNLDVEYFWAEGAEPGGRCLGYVDWREEGQARLRRPDYEHRGNSHPEMVPNAQLPPMFAIDALVGQRVAQRQSDGRYHAAVVTAVHGELDGGNRIELREFRESGTIEVEAIPIAWVCQPGPSAVYDGPRPPG